MPDIKTMLTVGLGLIGLVLWPAVAQAGPATLSATVAPAASGTSASPAGHTVTTSLSHVAADSSGNPKVALWTLTESFPVDLQTNFGSYATCPANVVVHGDNKPKCPDGSVLGHTSAAAYVPALLVTARTDAGYIFKTGENTVGTWSHVSNPTETGVVIHGVISRGASPYGPVITWDMSKLANGAEVGAEARVSAIKFMWDSGAAGSGDGTSNNAGKLRECRAKARKIKNSRKRKAALRRCAKRYPRNPKRAAAATGSTTPFVSTGCTGGSWMFHDQLTFADQSTDTADSRVACQ